MAKTSSRRSSRSPAGSTRAEDAPDLLRRGAVAEQGSADATRSLRLQGFLPRGAVAERGSTGGAGEGARPGGPQVHPAWTDATQSLHMSRISSPWSGSEAGE